MDSITSIERSAVMARVRSKNTAPELIVRSAVHALGYRFRLHRRDLPGTPDLVFPRRGKVIFVHGCFWHQHACAAGMRTPKSRVQFWRKKLMSNVLRDQSVVAKLRRKGWGVMAVWECQLKNPLRLARRLRRFLG